jgi:hypothetical protein
LNLSDEEFGDLSYCLFDALLKRKEEEERKRYIHTGILAAAIINFSGNRSGDPVDPLDFVPGTEKKELDLSKMSPKEQRAALGAMFNRKTYTQTVQEGDRILNV